MTNIPEPLRLARPGINCWTIARADSAAVVVDAADYFSLLEDMMRGARRRIMFLGWDFDTRIILNPERPGAPTLGELVVDLVKANPKLEVDVLRWNVGAYRSFFRGRMMLDLLKWQLAPRIKLRFDSAHPIGCSQHEKIVVIDDCLAVCGGIDTTSARWDVRGHPAADPRRTGPDGKRYKPWHDATMVISGEAARKLTELCLDRWKIATGEELVLLEPMEPIWPAKLKLDFKDVDVAISRTRAAWSELSEIRQVERLFVEMILAAETYIYIENQYLTSPAIAAAIADRLDDEDPPEIVLVEPEAAEGKFEQWAMDGARSRLLEELWSGPNGDRLKVYYPVTADGEAIYVHSKLMIVDDTMLRIGSANLNNRSMGLDTECDLMIEALDDEKVSERIVEIRNDLIAEHLGVEAGVVGAEIAAKGSMIKAIESLRHPAGHSLRPLQVKVPKGFEAFIADKQILDPEHAARMFEPFSKRGLLLMRVKSIGQRIRTARPTIRNMRGRFRGWRANRKRRPD